MGLTATDLDLLLELRRRNLPISRIATIGSLSLYLHPQQMAHLRQIIPKNRSLAEYRWGDTANPILCELTGASEVVSIDMSDYQGSSIVHDMNISLAGKRPDLAAQFDLVIDGGTLEHVFNFPVAVANLMFLVRKGGHVLSANPANNLCGHGFYQFTPELMYRIYSGVNGFSVDHVILTQSRHMSVEMDPRPKSFRVVDPASLGHRTLVRNRWPVTIRTLAERVGDQPSSGLNVQQSDYVTAWNSSPKAKPQGGPKAALRKIFHQLPRTLQSRISDILTRPKLGNARTMPRWQGKIE
jgi:hypothetical protein